MFDYSEINGWYLNYHDCIVIPLFILVTDTKRDYDFKISKVNLSVRPGYQLDNIMGPTEKEK